MTINWTNGSLLKINDTFTIRFNIRYDYDTNSSGRSLYYGSYSGNLIVFPYRVINNIGSVQVYLNGSINSNTAYNYVDATVCPSGRYIWTENYANTQLINNANTNLSPIYLSFVNQSSMTFNFTLPYGISGNSSCDFLVFLELINNCNPTQTTITTSGSSFFDSVQKTF